MYLNKSKLYLIQFLIFKRSSTIVAGGVFESDFSDVQLAIQDAVDQVNSNRDVITSDVMIDTNIELASSGNSYATSLIGIL